MSKPHVCIYNRECWCGAPVDGECAKSCTPTCWPMKSEAMGVHVDQIQEATDRNRRHGVNVTYDSIGRAILPDRKERKKLLRLEGFFDKAGGYGD